MESILQNIHGKNKCSAVNRYIPAKPIYSEAVSFTVLIFYLHIAHLRLQNKWHSESRQCQSDLLR